MFKFRKALTITVLAVAGLCFTGSVAFAASPAATDTAQVLADNTAAAADGAAYGGKSKGDNHFTAIAYLALAAGLGLGLAVIGGAIGQGRAAAAALDGIARNPGASGKIFTPMILGLALIESLVIYSLVVSIMLNGHLSKIVEKALGG